MLRGEYLMTGSGPAVIGQAILASAEAEVVESRFGQVTVYPNQAIYFPSGLLGMPDRIQFSLTHFPSDKMARFKLLQSLEDASLSFITLPVDIMNPIVQREDIEQAARDVGMALDDLALLLIVTVHRESGVVKLSVNARAPLMMSVSRRVAVQHVFANTKYQIRQPLAI
jgi:flagellar assembly factor FliW